MDEVTSEVVEAEALEADLDNIPADLDLGDDLAQGGEEPAVAEAPVAEDPFAAYGGKDLVEAAVKLHQATRDHDGLIQLFVEAGQALGLGVREMEALFQQGRAGEVIAAASAGAEADEDEDRFLTVKELRELEAKRQAEAAAAAQEAQVAAARATVANTFESLGVDPSDPTADLILQLGNKHLAAGRLDAESVSAAVRAGHAEFLSLVDKQAKAYLRAKRDQAAKVPSAPSGAGAPAAAPLPPPKNVDEAIRRVREQMRQQGR